MKSEDWHIVYRDPNGCKIYLGSVTAAMDRDFLRSESIGSVVTACYDMNHLQFDEHISHHVYKLIDRPEQNMSKYFSQFYDLVERKIKDRNIFVHCFAGISRSATLVISYLMKKLNIGYEEALLIVVKEREQVQPNEGFQKQLRVLEKILRGEQPEQEKKENEGPISRMKEIPDS